MMLSEPSPPILVRHYLLIALRDGFERITLRRGESEYWYDMFGLSGGEKFALIGPTAEAAQEFRTVLVGLSQQTASGGGWEAGEFAFSVGPGSVRGSYWVRWERGVVAELEIELPLATEAVAEAARSDLRESARAWGGEEYTEPDAA